MTDAGIRHFERHYHYYLEQMANIDFASIQTTLGLRKKEAYYFVSFFGRDYLLSGDGIQDDAGRRPSYVTCAVLAKYIIEHWIHHNLDHLEDYQAFAGELEAAGKAECAWHIRAMGSLLSQSNDHLKEALRFLG